MENTIGKRIATNRKRLGLTQEQLAEQLGITAQAVSKWENDQSCPDINVLPALADIFGISTDVLLGRVQLPVQTTSNSTDDSANDCDEDDDFDDGDDDKESGNDSRNHKEFNIKIDAGGEGKLALFGMATWFLTVGILFLLAKLYTWDCSFWDILWPSFLLIFGIFGIIGNVGFFNLSCAAVGAFFMVNNLAPLSIKLDKGILWAVIIIVCGITLLIDALRKKHRRVIHTSNSEHAHEYHVEDGKLFASNTFGEANQIIVTDHLKSGNITNRFGEYTLDLSGVVSVSDNCTIETTCSFGELEIKVPKHYRVEHKVSSAFAELDIQGSPDEEIRGVIYLNGSVNFGEITIQYI